MKQTTKSKTSYASIALIIYVLYLCLFDFIEAGSISQLHFASYGILAMIFILLFMDWYNRGAVISCSLSSLVWMPFVALLAYHVIKYEQAKHYILLFVISLLLVFSISRAEQLDKPTKILAGFAIFYFITQTLQWLMPGIYRGIVGLFINGAAANEQMSAPYLTGLTAQVSHTAIYLIFGIGIAVCLRRKNTVGFWILLCACALGLILTQKRAHSLLSIAAILVVYILGGNKKLSKFFRVLVTLFCIAIVIGIFILLRDTLTKIPLISRIYDMVDAFMKGGADDVFGEAGRQRLYDGAREQIKLHPGGIGWGNFIHVSTLYVSYTTSVHNIYLQLICETGVIGLVLFIIPLAYTLLSSLWALITINDRQLKASDAYRYALLSVFIQVIWIVYGFSGNPLYNENYLIMYFLALAFFMPLRREMRSRSANGFRTVQIY